MIERVTDAQGVLCEGGVMCKHGKRVLLQKEGRVRCGRRVRYVRMSLMNRGINVLM